MNFREFLFFPRRWVKKGPVGREECARPTGGRHGLTTGDQAQRFKGAMRRGTLEVG
jgi:hypothetical protein